MQRCIAPVVLCAIALTLGMGGAGAAGAAVSNRCEAAQILLADGQRDLAVAQLKKALDRPATIECAAHMLVELAPAPATTADARCPAASKLREGGLLDDAKELYKGMLDGDEAPLCAIDGLLAVAADEKRRKVDDKRLNPDEAWQAVDDFVRGTAWPWPAGLALLVLAAAFARRLFPPKRIVVKASSDDEKFALEVIEAANGAGDQGPLPAKLATAKDSALPADMAADLTAVLRLPAGIPVAQFLSIPAAQASSRLSVTRSSAGGWEVAEMTLRRPFRRKRYVRIPLELGGLPDATRESILALACGAWLVTIIAEDQPGPFQVTQRDDDAALAHACYRAGASRQTSGDSEGAMICYSAMPAVCRTQAPFAWTSVRLNMMVLMKAQARWTEAAQFAGAVKGVPGAMLDLPDAREYFGAPELKALRSKEVYMTAVHHIDRYASEPGDDDLRATAHTAAERLREEIRKLVGADGPTHDPSLVTSMRLVALCQAILAKEDKTIEDVEAMLVPPKDGDTHRPALGAAAHYDAACAVSLLLGQRCAPGVPRNPDAESALLKRGLALLATAVRATAKDRLPRVRAMARADAMLSAIRVAAATEGDAPAPVESAGFLSALGESADVPADARIAVDLTQVASA